MSFGTQKIEITNVLDELSERITAQPSASAAPYYIGAHLILNLLRNHEDDQSAVMRLFDRQLALNGIAPMTLEGRCL